MDKAQALNNRLADGLVKAADDLRAEVLEFHCGGACAGEGKGAAGEFYWRGAGGELRAGEGVPVRKQVRGGGRALSKGRANDWREKGGDAAGGVVAGRFGRFSLACWRRLRLARGSAGRHILFA